MVDGKRRDEWERTSHVLAWLENVNKAKDQRPTRPWSRNPYLIKSAKACAERHSDVGRLAAVCGVKVE